MSTGTKAGQALHDHYHEDGADHSGCSLNQKILDIEREAGRATVERIRAAVREIADGPMLDVEAIYQLLDAEDLVTKR